MSVVKDSGIVEKSSEVSTRNVFLEGRSVQIPTKTRVTRKYHCQIDTPLILEGIQQLDKPFTRSIRQDITFCQNVSDLIQLE